MTSTSWWPHGRGAPSRSRCAVSTTTKWSSSPKAEPKVDPEAEKRWKLAEEARQKLESDLRLLKEELARKPAEPKAPAPRPAPRIATIYRGIGHSDHRGSRSPRRNEAGAGRVSATPETAALGMQRGFRTGSLGSLTTRQQP